MYLKPLLGLVLLLASVVRAETPIVLLVGPPAAGKGTVAIPIQADLKIPALSVGQILRDRVAERDPTALRLKAEYMDHGRLIPFLDTWPFVRARLQSAEFLKGFILDGYPRDLPQAQLLEPRLEEIGMKISDVLLLNVPDELLESRATGRRVCPVRNCPTSYHLVSNPPKVEGRCDLHKDAVLKTRDDDRPEVVRARLNDYHKLTEPMIDYYRSRRLVHEIDASKNPAHTLEQARRILRRFY